VTGLFEELPILSNEGVFHDRIQGLFDAKEDLLDLFFGFFFLKVLRGVLGFLAF